MSWIRSAMHKAADVPGGAIFRAAVRTYADTIVQHAGYSVSGATRMFHDRIATRNMKSYSDAARRLEEVSVSCKGEERVQLLKRWLVALKECERLNESPVENDGRVSEDPCTSSDKNVTILYYDHDPDLGSSPMNFRDVFLQSQALEGITMSMILGAPNEEEILLLHEIFGLCLTGGKEVHDVVVKNIQELAKTFSVYDVEMLVRREELLQFAQTAVTGLKTGDILRIDSEISQIQQRLTGMKCQKSAGEGSESLSDSTSNASLKDTEEPVEHILLCCRLKSLLQKKQMLRKGDTIETHSQKVDILKVLIESLQNSAFKSEKRILENREEKKEALTFRVARTNEVCLIEKELGAEISVLEKQRDKLEAELREVNSTLAAANMRLQNAREERLQFDEDNNEFLLLLKEKEDELSRTIVSYRAEADTCYAFVNFLEATWDFQSSYVEQRDKQVTEQLQNHEVYFVNATTSFLSTYKDQLPPAIANVRTLVESLKGFRKIVDPDEEFLEDIKQRENAEQEYLDAEARVINIFDAVERIKENFYITIDDNSRKGVEVVTELLEDIEKIKSDFKTIKRPDLVIVNQTERQETQTTGSPKGVMVPAPIRVMPDFKSIFAQKLLIKSPRNKPYIPLGGSPENSPVSIMENDAKSAQKTRVWESETQSHPDKDVPKLTYEATETSDQESKMNQHSKNAESGQEKTSEPSKDSNDEIPKMPLVTEESIVENNKTETVNGKISQVSVGGEVKSEDPSRIEKDQCQN